MPQQLNTLYKLMTMYTLSRVEFALTDESFSLFDDAGRRGVFPGVYTVYIGGGQPDDLTQRAAVEIGE